MKLFHRNIASYVLPVDSKGALLILLWSTMIFIYQFFLFNYIANDTVVNTSLSYASKTTIAIAYVTVPAYLLIGLVADICVGRYRIIVASIYCSFTGWIVLCVPFYITHKYTHITLLAVGYLLATVGAAGIQSIAVPFNIDQMIGARADQLSAVVYWYAFGYPLGLSMVKISSCFITDIAYQQSLSICVSGVAITIVMATYYLFRHHLNTTPLLTNPVKLIFKVLNYARKNKYPRLRSALTYWEESAPSRLDLGKDKYGGPFTEEEVEDVKTFFRFVPLLVCLFGLSAATIIAPSVKILNIESRGTIFNCLLQNKGIIYLTMATVLVTYKLVLSKHCYKYLPSMIKRIGLGLSLLLFSIIVLVVMDVKDYNKANNCTLTNTVYDATNIDYALITVHQIIHGVGGIIVLLLSLELTVAQSPGHMRGLMVSVTYGTGGLFLLLSYAIYLPHRLIYSHCTLYYHVTVSVCVVVSISVYGVLAKRYKLRTRNDPVNIPHIVATVYERYIEQSQQYRQLHGGSETLTYESVED